MTAAPAPRFGVEACARFLLAPDAGERLSPAGDATAPEGCGPGAVLLDLAASPARELQRFGEAVARALPLLPCVTIALTGPDPSPACKRLAEVCDVAVEDRSKAEPLLERVGRAPIASLAFVQLLRGAPRASVQEGLVAESFVYSTLQAGREFGDWLASRRRRRRRSRVQSGPAVHFERVRDCLEIRLMRPDKHNAFSRAMRDGLCEALQLALADPSIEQVVLSGEGDSFCSGGDLDEFGSLPDPAQGHAIRTTRSPALLLSQLADRVRVSVHGACIGAGAELPAFTSHVVASEDAYFELPEVALGLVPGAGGTVSLPNRIGRQRTAWLGLSGARIDARTALAWGLVDEVRLGQHPDPHDGRDVHAG